MTQLKRPVFVMLAVGAAILGNASAVRAQSVGDLAASLSAGGLAQDRFPEATRAIWVRFAYTDASFTTIEVTLSSPSGVLMFSREAEFQGSGTQEWEVTGDEVARGLAGRAAEASSNAQDSARRAATQQHGVNEYLAATTYAVSQLTSTTGQLGRLPLDAATRTHLAQTTEAARELQVLLAAAQRLPTGDTPGRQEYARQMSAPAGRALAAASSLEIGVRQSEGLPMPPTRSSTSDRDAHTVSARVNGSAAKSLSVWFFDGKVYLPAVAAAR
jgi:hypothetical protein